MDLLIQLEKTFRDNVDPRRHQERNDSRMVREDHKAMANLSETPVYHQFDPWKDVERLKSY